MLVCFWGVAFQQHAAMGFQLMQVVGHWREACVRSRNSITCARSVEWVGSENKWEMFLKHRITFIMWLLLDGPLNLCEFSIMEKEKKKLRQDETSSNHLNSVQTKRCQQFSFGLTFWGLFTRCYSDMWAHISWEFYGTFPIVGLNLP